MSIPVLVAVVASLTSILAAFISSGINYFLNERSKNKDREINEHYKQIEREQLEQNRKADLFKIVYPEKVKAAQALMQASSSLYHSVTSYAVWGDENNQEAINKFLEASDDVFALSTAYEWVLGTEVETAGRAFAVMTRQLFSAIRMAKQKDNRENDERAD